MQSFSRTVARNSAFGMASQLAIKVISFLFTVLIVRQLGQETWGQYNAVLAWGALFVFLADLGLGPYTVREIARLRDTPDGQPQIAALYRNILTLRFLLSLLTAAVLIGGAWLWGHPPAMIGAIALGTIGLVMYSAEGAFEAALAGHERLGMIAGARVLQRLLFITLGAVALYTGVGYYGLILADLAGVALLTFVCWRTVRTLAIPTVQPQPMNWLPLLRASIPFGVIGFTLGISYKFDTVLLQRSWGDLQAGYYNSAYSLVFSAAMISNVINTALYPSMTRQANSDPASLPAVYARSLRYLLLIALPIAVGGWALAPQLLPFMYKAESIPAIPALQIVIWVVPLMYVSEFLGYVVLIAGQERKVARSVIISTTVNVLCNLYAVPRFGLYGAAVMTVITEAVLVTQYLWLLWPQLRTLPWLRTVGLPALAAGLMGLAALGLMRLDVDILLVAPIVALVYVAALAALGLIGRDEIQFVRGFRRETPASSSSEVA